MVKETKLHKKNVLLLAGIILLILIGIFRNQINTLFGIFYGVTIDKAINLTKPQKDTFNIALFGIGGGGHDGPNLTDTIILANVNVKQNKVHLFSIPRDLWVPDLSHKINAAYQTGIDRNNSLGYTKQVIEKVAGQNMDYMLILDFDGFIKLVDELGGIDVDVANTLDDYNYPIDGKEGDLCGHSEEDVKSFVATGPAEMLSWDYFNCRYKHLHVASGLNHMDGITALEFVRSRHGVGKEGSDFARSKRQQLVITALRNKAMSLGVLLNPVKLLAIYNILKDNIHTDISTDKIDDFIKLAQKLKNGQIDSNVIDVGDNERLGLLINPPPSQEYSFAWVLSPRVGNGNFTEIHDYIACVIKNNTCTVGEKGIYTPTPAVSPKTTN